MQYDDRKEVQQVQVALNVVDEFLKLTQASLPESLFTELTSLIEQARVENIFQENVNVAYQNKNDINKAPAIGNNQQGGAQFGSSSSYSTIGPRSRDIVKTDSSFRVSYQIFDKCQLYSDSEGYNLHVQLPQAFEAFGHISQEFNIRINLKGDDIQVEVELPEYAYQIENTESRMFLLYQFKAYQGVPDWKDSQQRTLHGSTEITKNPS